MMSEGGQKRKSQREEMGIRTTNPFIFGLANFLEPKQGHCTLLPFWHVLTKFCECAVIL